MPKSVTKCVNEYRGVDLTKGVTEFFSGCSGGGDLIKGVTNLLMVQGCRFDKRCYKIS